jgi:DMSO/TMAO reductase YedYZ molybdopterin-dependent catalytic subunit
MDEEDCMSRLKDLKTPVFWAEGHPGSLDREGWQIEVRGLVSKPRVYAWADLMTLPRAVVDGRLTSVTRFSVRGVWGGVRLSDVLADVEALPEARFVRFWSVKRIYDTSIPMEIAIKERTLLTWEFDGEFLEEDYGGPVRAFVPYLWGYKSAKSIVRIELMDRHVPGYWEQRGYSDEGLIETGLVRDMNDGGRIRHIPGGEVLGFIDE